MFFPKIDDHYQLWALPWKLAWQNKVKQYEIRIILPFGYIYISIDWVDFCWAEWHEIHVICQKMLG